MNVQSSSRFSGCDEEDYRLIQPQVLHLNLQEPGSNDHTSDSAGSNTRSSRIKGTLRRGSQFNANQVQQKKPMLVLGDQTLLNSGVATPLK